MLVQVKGYRTVVESLDAEYLDFESFTGENQWLCSKCNKKVRALALLFFGMPFRASLSLGHCARVVF